MIKHTVQVTMAFSSLEVSYGLCRVLGRSWDWTSARWMHSRCASCSTMCTPASALARALFHGLTAL